MIVSEPPFQKPASLDEMSNRSNALSVRIFLNTPHAWFHLMGLDQWLKKLFQPEYRREIISHHLAVGRELEVREIPFKQELGHYKEACNPRVVTNHYQPYHWSQLAINILNHE